MIGHHFGMPHNFAVNFGAPIFLSIGQKWGIKRPKKDNAHILQIHFLHFANSFKMFAPISVLILAILPSAVVFSANTLVVAPSSTNTALNSCLAGNASYYGTFKQYLNTQISGAEFTFYGASGTGACGLNSGLPSMSAAASGAFFGGSWVKPCTGSQYVLSNQVCINKCVQITYTCVGCSSAKTLTVPINNECPECAYNHVDLSQAAFNWLEPQGGTVGVAKNAVIKYITCPSSG